MVGFLLLALDISCQLPYSTIPLCANEAGCAQKDKGRFIMLYDWKFRFRDLGPVRDASLTLGDLTIITGRNNTGKTYMVYTLYGFLRHFSELADEVMEEWSKGGQFSNRIHSPIETIAGELLSKGKYEQFLFKNDIVEDRIQLIRQMCRKYSHNEIDYVFNAQAGSFARSVFDVEVDQGGADHNFAGFVVETQLGGTLQYTTMKPD